MNSKNVHVPPPGVRKSLTRPGLDASEGTRSHDSLPTLGAHPLGSLHIHHGTDPEARASGVGDEKDEGDEEPPSLDPPVNDSHSGPDFRSSQPLTSITRASQSHGIINHNMGGGDVVLILNLPDVFMIGYDSISFTAKHFGGVRDIPPGPHFFWVAHPDGISARCGFWVLCSDVNRVHVMQWDTFNETLGLSGLAEARIQTENLDSFHAKLTPYTDPTAVAATQQGKNLTDAAAVEHDLGIWPQLTGNITEEVLNRVTSQYDGDWQIHTADRIQGAVLMAGEIELDKTMSSVMMPNRHLNFSFTQSSKTYSTDRIGAERTLEATDSTPYILSLMDGPTRSLSENDLVGEFQFAFIVGMHLGNDSCVQQWWHMLLKLLLKAYLLPVKHPNIAASFLRTLSAQLSYSTNWLETSILDYSDVFSRELRLSLIIYKRRLDELLSSPDASSTLANVGAAFARLETVVAAFDWDIRGQYLRKGKIMMEDGEEVELEMADLEAEDERGEWAPEIVDLDENGRQKDLVSWND